MNTKTFLSPIVLLIMALTILTACGGGKNSSSSSSDDKTATVQSNKPLNISIYLDLSDRLERQMVPSQKERDIEIVNYLTEVVKNHAVAQKILPSRDRIKVFFYPTPNDSKIALLSQDLEMDLSKAQPAEKKQMLLDFQEKFNTSLTKIYEATMQDKNWIGSDIWGFFKKQVDTYCIRADARNIIVILTDGYLFYAPNKQKNGNNYSYILPQTLSNPNSGLIVSRQGLDNLEVLLLEVNPYDPKHQDQMETILQNWFNGMGVQKIYVGVTDQPSNTRLIIDKFMN
jgi:hypothetical protein